MLAGALYRANDPALLAARARARRLCAAFNTSDPADLEHRRALLHGLLASAGDGAWIEPPFHCDYGSQITLGHRVFVNFGAIFLDPASISLGDDVQLGPGVQLLTADHPRDADERVTGLEMARPISIGDRAWLGGGVIVCPGVVIGANTIVGAGSVVTRDVPAGVVAVGNPCRVIRRN